MVYALSHNLLRLYTTLVDFCTDHLLALALALLAAAIGVAAALRPTRVKQLGYWVLFPCLLILLAQLLGVVGRETLERMDLAASSRYTTSGSSAGGDTLQYSPTVSYEVLTQREETLSFSEKSFEVRGLASLPGWNGNSYNEDVVSVEDHLEKTVHATLVRRKLVFSHRIPIKLEASLLNLDLKFSPDSIAYQATFEAEYRFRNPLDNEARIRFRFPLPLDSGTLSDFTITCNGKPSEAEWEDLLPAGQSVVVKVAYKNKGRRSWTYSPTQRRALVDQLKLKVRSDNSRLKFRRDSLFPTSQKGETWDWDLDGVITPQDISLFFPTNTRREGVARFLTFAPIALVGFALALLAWSPQPRRISVAICAYAGGFILVSYLWTYLGFFSAIATGTLVGCGVSLWILGRRGWRPCLVALLLPTAFFFEANTGLCLVSAGLALIAWWGR